jgi:hypothetical protein
LGVSPIGKLREVCHRGQGRVKTICPKIPNWIMSDTLILFVTGSEAFNR